MKRKLNQLCRFVLMAGVSLLLEIPAVSAACKWTITDLGVNGEAYAINRSNHVVGRMDVPVGPWRAFLYRDGTAIDLGTLGAAPGQNPSSWARDINDQGEIVGHSSSPAGGDSHPFLYSNGTMKDLGFPGFANAINNRSQIVGQTAGELRFRPFLYSDGVRQDLEPLFAMFSGASDVNERGEILINTWANPDTSIRVSIYHEGVSTEIDPGPSPPAPHMVGVDINESGVVAGYFTHNESPIDGFPFIYRDGTVTPLPIEGAVHPAAINNRGDVVGSVASTPGAPTEAFLYADGAMTNLNSLPEVAAAGWTLRTAHDLTDCRQIVGGGVKADRPDRLRAFLLKPVLGVSVTGSATSGDCGCGGTASGNSIGESPADSDTAGGCALNPNAAFDPLLPLLLVIAAGVLYRRRQQRVHQLFQDT